MDDKIRMHKQMAMGTIKGPPASINCGCDSLAKVNGGSGGNDGPNNAILSDSQRSGKSAG
jgi:hypothetical protein